MHHKVTQWAPHTSGFRSPAASVAAFHARGPAAGDGDASARLLGAWRAHIGRRRQRSRVSVLASPPSGRAQVANAFVNQYFSVRHTAPGNICRFYNTLSVAAWPARLEWPSAPGSPGAEAGTPSGGAEGRLLDVIAGPVSINVKARAHVSSCATQYAVSALRQKTGGG